MTTLYCCGTCARRRFVSSHIDQTFSTIGIQHQDQSDQAFLIRPRAVLTTLVDHDIISEWSERFSAY